MIPELLNRTSHGFRRRVNSFVHTHKFICLLMAREDRLGCLGILNPMATRPFQSIMFNAIAINCSTKPPKSDAWHEELVDQRVVIRGSVMDLTTLSNFLKWLPMNCSPSFFWSLIRSEPQGRSKSRHRFVPIALFQAFALLISMVGRYSVASAQNAPPPDTNGSLVLFDFGDANDKQIRDAAIARFNKRFPNVKVTDQFTPIASWADYLNKLIAQVASGKVA